ncbi:MAG: hypothetical protein K5Q68_17160 [Roseococcus sp.]|nr:hypothetical protein [Roseococcus sp.]
MIRCLVLLVLLLGVAPPAHAQASGGGVDCHAHFFPDPTYRSRPLGDGRYLYEVELVNRGQTAIRYTYSFALPGSTFPAEALHGYLLPRTSTEHALGTGDRNLGAAAIQAATTLRCFSL